MVNDIARRVQSALDELGAEYRVIEIDPALADTAAFCERYGYAPEASANAILVASKRPPGRHALSLVLATTRLDVNRKVRELLGVKKLSFAPADLTLEVTGMMIGGVTPFGLDERLPIYIDARVMALDQVIVGGGDRATKVLVDPEVFGRMPAVQIIEGLAHPFARPPAEPA